MNVHPHLSTPDPYLLPFSLVWLVLRCLAVFSSARMEHSPGTRYDSPAHYLLNLCCWRVNLVHFPSSPFSPVGKREIEEEVNQARALTYSTKKENCAVVNSLRGAWFVWIAFKAGSRPLLTVWRQVFSFICF